MVELKVWFIQCPELIDLLVEEFVNEDIEIVTAAGKTLNAKQLNDYNTVKVMVDRDKFATAFRRDPIEMESGGYYHHAGIYAYRQDILDKFTSLKPSANEVKYKLEQLRAIDNGISIKVALTDRVNRGIDTLEDLNEMKK